MLLRVPLQFSEVVKGIHIIQLARMNQAHVQITYLSTIQRLIKKRVLPVQNRFLQGAFNKIMPTPGLCRADETSSLPAFLSMLTDAA
jgi:hypothetical protein